MHFIRHSLLTCLTTVSLVAAAQIAAPAAPTTTPDAATAGTGPETDSAPSARDKTVIKAAFYRAAMNGDGTLSNEEAARMPAVAAEFEELDTNKDGGLGMQEFSVGYMSAVN